MSGSVIAFASAQALVELSNNFVNSIVSPVAALIVQSVGIKNLSDYKIGNLLIGSFIEAIVKFAIVAIILLLLSKVMSY